MIWKLMLALTFCYGAMAGPKLPDGIKWQTNENITPFGSPKAKKGGVYKTFMLSYPLTFRLWGPNSNDAFAYFNRKSCLEFYLVERHPNTRELVPVLATHWAVMPDQKTVYYKLRKEAKFSDGVPITADHYVFAFKMMLSEHIKAPYYNKHHREQFESVEKIDKYTIKIVGARPSWKAMDLYYIYPVASHSFKLDKNWVKKTNWQPPVCAGPYKIWKEKKGRYVKLKKVENWWGNSLPYFKSRYNFDVIDIKVIRDSNVAFEHFKKGNLTQYRVNMSALWAKETDFEAVKKGWVKKRRIFVHKPAGKYGIFMNLKFPLFKNKDFRKGLQHLFDFDKINKNLMYNAYFRIRSFSPGTEYENKKLKGYNYSQAKAAEFFKKAGFVKRGSDGYLIDKNANKASFTLTYGSRGLTRHLSVVKEDFKTAGVEMKLRLVDNAKAFKDGLDKNFEASLTNRTANFYPAVEQYLGSGYAEKKNNNNIASFANSRVDELIQIYKGNLNFNERLKAMEEIDKIVEDEAFYIPFWDAPYKRSLSWSYMEAPDFWEGRYSQQGVLNEFDTYWIDPEKKKNLEKLMREDKPIKGANDKTDVDAFGIKS